MSEKDLWATTRNKMRWYGHFDRIENMVGSGRPDVNYCVRGVEGNIELKHAPRWPVRGGVLPLKHFTPAQRNWIRDRLRARGRVYVLLQVGSWYGLFHGHWARLHLGVDATEPDCRAAARCWAEDYFPAEAMLYQLTEAPFTFP